MYRILLVTSTERLAQDMRGLLNDELSGAATAQAIDFLREHFAVGPAAIGSIMAGRTEEGVGEPETVALQTSTLAADLVRSLGWQEDRGNAVGNGPTDTASSSRTFFSSERVAGGGGRKDLHVTPYIESNIVLLCGVETM